MQWASLLIRINQIAITFDIGKLTAELSHDIPFTQRRLFLCRRRWYCERFRRRQGHEQGADDDHHLELRSF